MKVTILIVAYNAERYIQDCIESIIKQTYKDFEVIFIDDGSTDQTYKIISQIKDCRFVVFHREHDYISSLNYGLSIAKGDYIARMDADDIMLPNRIEEQIKVMNAHPEVDVCGSWVKTFGKATFKICTAQEKIKNPLSELLIKNIFTHPTIMIRKNFLIEHKLRYKEYPYAEDYKLWVDIALCGGVFWIIPNILLYYRLSEHQVSNTHYREQNLTALKIQNEILLAILNDTDCIEIESLQNIYLHLENLNSKRILSAETIRYIIYSIYRELKYRQ